MKEKINRCFANLQDGVLTVGNKLFRHVLTDVSDVTTEIDDADGHTEPYLHIRAKIAGESWESRLWNDLPLLEIRVCRELSLPFSGQHWELRTICLHDLTDIHDTFATETTQNLFLPQLLRSEGNPFYFEDAESGDALILICLTPDYLTPYLEIRDGVLTLFGKGCGAVIGYCRAGECEKITRSWYRHAWKHDSLHAMSNTWGDRNGWSRVEQNFIRNEINVAAEIGIDIVQIDDGWQTGSTADQKLRDKEVRRMFIGDFWEFNWSRFPDGIPPLTAYAQSRGIRMGLWFAPDSRDDFALLERDKVVLRHAYDEWGGVISNLRCFRFFPMRDTVP